MAKAELKAVITAEDRASRVLKGVGHSVGKFAKFAVAGFAAVSTAAVVGGTLAVKAFNEEEQAVAQLRAVLKSTNGVAGVTEKSARDLASSLQKVTTFGDEAIIGGENLLLTFTKIGKDIFPEATEVMLDMSQALGQDMKSSAVQLGKALQDPILGVTALRRVGVNFSDAQRDVIKNLVETGRSAEAQKLILKELQTEFGGSARAARHTFGGSLKALQNTVGDVMEVIGAKIADTLGDFVANVATWFEENQEQIQEAVKLTGEVIGTVFTAIYNVIKVVMDWIKQNGPAILNAFKAAWEFLKPSIMALWNTIKNNLLPELKKLWQQVIKPMIPVIGVILVAAFKAVINIINVAIKIFVFSSKVFRTNVNIIVSTIKFLWNIAKTLFNIWKTGWNAMLTPIYWINNFLQSVINKVQELLGWIGQLGQKVGGAFSGITGFIGNLNPFRAEGGPVAANTPYIVGERGPELFVPRSAGTVVSNDNMPSNSGVNLTVNVGVFTGTAVERRKLASMIWNDIQQIEKRRGNGVFA